jgi:arginyl-tRNA synthetase
MKALMDPITLRNSLSRILGKSVKDLWSVDSEHIPVTPVGNPDFGDLSSSVAMKLSRELSKAPKEIADILADRISDVLPSGTSVSVAGPGFINFTLSEHYLVEVLLEVSKKGLAVLLPAPGKGMTALVEFVSSNPTGPLTVGHCRQAVLGEAVSRLLEALGWKVEREYYFNDTGRQMRLLGESLAVRYGQLSGVQAEIPEGGYLGDYLVDWAGELMHEDSSLEWPADADRFGSFARRRAMSMISSDLELMGIEFFRYFTESELIPERVEEAIGLLRNIRIDGSDLVYEKDGKLWLRLTALGRPDDRVVLREDGNYTYRMPDIAYHLDKFRRDYPLIVDIFGADHLDTSRDVVSALECLLGRETVQRRLKVIIHQFVTLLRHGEKIRMSTRAANFVTMRSLIEEVGSVDVTRYLFLTRRADAHMDFDLDVAVSQSDENPVYYVQYAHARISGILRNASLAGIGIPGSTDGLVELLSGSRERSLMRLIETLPDRITQAGEVLEPHRLTEMLAELAAAFHTFYQHHRVIDTEKPLLSSARLLLCEACRRTLGGMLDLLGVAAPERM